VVFILLTVVASLSLVNADYLLPILYDPLAFARGTLKMANFPYGETVVLTSIYALRKHKDHPYRAWLLPWLVGGLLISIIYARNVAVLGENTATMLGYATYYADGIISYENFLQRIEVVMAMFSFLSALVSLIVTLHFVCCGLDELLELRSPAALSAPVLCLAFGLSMCLNITNVQMVERYGWIKFAALVLQMLLPALLGLQLQTRAGKTAVSIRLQCNTDMPECSR